MSVPVLVALASPTAEAAIVAELARPPSPVEVVRRCVEVGELLAAAASGVARAALVSDDLRRLDRDALVRLGAVGVGVVGLATDEPGERLLRDLGIAAVFRLTTPVPELAAALVVAASAPVRPPGPAGMVDADVADPATSLPSTERPAGSGLSDVVPAFVDGWVLAVWGPVGSPGRTLTAVNLAAELAMLGVPTLLADADVYGGVVAQVLGLLDEAPGLVAAARAANVGTLDLPALGGYARSVELPGGASMGVLTGLARAERWSELRPASLVRVLELSRQLAAVTVVDCAFCLEADEELAYDVAAPRRNGATLAVLGAAERVLAVGSADPVGLARLVRGLSSLGEAVPGIRPRVVLNRLRGGPVPGDPRRQVTAALERFAGCVPTAVLPEDRAAADATLASGQVLAEVSPAAPLRLALRALAADLVGHAVAPAPRRLGMRRPRRSAAAPVTAAGRPSQPTAGR